MKIKESRIIKDYLRSRTKDDYITKNKDIKRELKFMKRKQC
jgi:hypothetical protein